MSSPYNRTNAIPNVPVSLRTKFSKYGQPFNPYGVGKAIITKIDPRDGSYDPEEHLIEEIPAANVANVGLGIYEYTLSANKISEVGTYFDSLYFQLEAGGPEYIVVNSFEVTATGLPKLGYITVADVRAEGLTDATKYPDSLINKRIAFNTKLIETMTGRWFEPRPMIMDVDGPGAYMIQLEAPIVSIKEITLLDREFPVTQVFTYELDDIVVYNRHISQKLNEPDDREDPKIGNVYFPKGRQNVRINGVFGYTDSYGQTPPEIIRALTLMVIRDKELLASNRRNQSLLRGLGGKVRSESTDGHSYSLAVPEPVAGQTPYFTGDEEIDHLLHSFVRPMKLGQGLGANVNSSVDAGQDFDRFRAGFDFFFGRSV